jgi:hypothetical protein
MDWLWLKGEGPGDIPPWAYRCLTVEMKVPPEALVGLRAVQRYGFWQGQPVTFIRIYNPLSTEGVCRVSDFTSLDEHAQFIVYEGYRGKSGQPEKLERRQPA